MSRPMLPNHSPDSVAKLPNVTVLNMEPHEPKCLRLLSSDLTERMAKIRVLLADDHEAILAKVRTLLGEDFDVVNAVKNGQDAVDEVKRLRPDVLIIDISMPVLNGLEAVSQLQASGSSTKIVILTVHEDPEIVSAAIHLGASAYIVKEQIARDLIPAIHKCLQGGSFISKSIQR
jgi:DNA-binding NarL/FixJ family response regulator